MQHFVIAIDGPSASGKSTVAKAVTARLSGFVYVDTGAMFRAITWLAMGAGIAQEDTAALAQFGSAAELKCEIQDAATVLSIGGTPIPAQELRSASVAATVSYVARVPEVRARLVAMQRELLASASLVMEGRDIGSVVFPETPFKFYLEANEAVRAQRRSAQGETDSISQRDKLDSTRSVAPLMAVEGAQIIDSSGLGVSEVVDLVVQSCLAKGLPKGLLV